MNNKATCSSCASRRRRSSTTPSVKRSFPLPQPARSLFLNLPTCQNQRRRTYTSILESVLASSVTIWSAAAATRRRRRPAKSHPISAGADWLQPAVPPGPALPQITGDLCPPWRLFLLPGGCGPSGAEPHKASCTPLICGSRFSGVTSSAQSRTDSEPPVYGSLCSYGTPRRNKGPSYSGCGKEASGCN